MSSGFVITVSCEDFFKDARKSIALFFNNERFKTVVDLKLKLRSLVNSDFYVLWSPSEGEDYHYLLEDEKLHFIQPKDRFKICKISGFPPTVHTVGNYNQFSIDTTDIQNNVIPSNQSGPMKNESKLKQISRFPESTNNDTIVNESKLINNNSQLNGTLEPAENDDILMDYEDVVDKGNTKRRKRTRNHKTKKQKLNHSVNDIDVPQSINTTSSTFVVQNVETHSRKKGSHLRFEAENISSYEQVDIEQEAQTICTDERKNGEDEDKKRKKNKKKAKRKDCENISYAAQNSLKKVILDPLETPSAIEVEQNPTDYKSQNSTRTDFVASSFNANVTNVITSTALNSPVSVTKKSSKRRRPINSLASFINELSESMKAESSTKVNFKKDIQDNPVMKKKTEKTSSELTSNKTLYEDIIENRKHEPVPVTSTRDLIKMNAIESKGNTLNGIFINQTLSENNPSSHIADLSNADRKFKRQRKKPDAVPTNEDRLLALDNLQQLKYSNTPSMPLVFERDFSHSRVVHETQDMNGETIVNDVNGEAIVNYMNGEAIVNDMRGETTVNGIVEAEDSSKCEEFYSKMNEYEAMQRNERDGELSYERLSEMSVEALAQYPLLKEPPAVNTNIIFKVLKMDASYNPILSDYICAFVLSVCESTRQLSLSIIYGDEELRPPKGKFSLDTEENGLDEQGEVEAHSVNWNEMFDSRSVPVSLSRYNQFLYGNTNNSEVVPKEATQYPLA